MDNLVWIVLLSMLAGGIIDRVFAVREWKKFYEGQDSVGEYVQRVVGIKESSGTIRRKAGVDDRTPR